MSKDPQNPSEQAEKKQPARIAIKDGKIFREINHGLYNGWQEVTGYELVETSRMKTNWLGSKISWNLWQEITSFMRWSQMTYKCEALITLFYNRVTGEWKAWPFPQHPVGMTVKYETDHPLYKTDRLQFGKDWVQLGSVHHHCTSSAFQSGTDKADEENRDGLHITLGKLDQDKMDIDLRQVFDGIQSTATVFSWIAMPNWVMQVPIAMRYELFTNAVVHASSQTGGGEVEFNEEWKKRVIEKKSSPSQLHLASLGNGNAGGGVNNTTGNNILGKNWREGRRIICEAIAAALKISATEAYLLLTEENIMGMSEERLVIRRELMEQLNEALCPPMWASTIYEEISNDDIANAASMGHGV